MNVAVLGAGAWGTALAKTLVESGHQVRLWARHPERVKSIAATGVNERYLPDIRLPSELTVEAHMDRTVRDCEVVVVAVPSKAVREVSEELAEFDGLVISVTKGIEYSSGLTMCGVLAQTVRRARRVALSGPTLALEVARGIPTAIVAASEDLAAAQAVQQLFHRPTFRVYTSPDPLGVELGGALKNVVAIAAGAGDGLGFGDNSKAALITRGIVEIRRLGVACGAQADTFAGLSGLGDLTVTCYSRLSRNRLFGERLGKGQSPEAILSEFVSVAEGHPTARSACRLARQLGLSTPIIDEVYAVLYEGKNVAKAVHDLTSRETKAED
jgi:glycerol-3-phosphate dehydrogenase (NAD(P)+)